MTDTPPADWSRHTARARAWFESLRTRICAESGTDREIVWQELQSLARTSSPLAVLCLSSWQRKQPGQSLCPMLFG